MYCSLYSCHMIEHNLTTVVSFRVHILTFLDQHLEAQLLSHLYEVTRLLSLTLVTLVVFLQGAVKYVCVEMYSLYIHVEFLLI